ncbi:hypothetical protein EVAR_101279_1 [Eumeta japonica]|uniref:Uncharacterized protein n=1 Tax=Eumeta variegata TaxID=151549 RepID=A0A4C1SCG0_EUMVA|nr:hypothetical protein EVAR_101279_1 [Eumeta japonica]
MDFEVQIFIETAESLNVWAVNFNAVVGGADGFTVVYPQTGAVCGYLEEVSAFGGSLGLGGAVGLAPVLGAVLAVTACVEAETGFRVDSTEAVLVV